MTTRACIQSTISCVNLSQTLALVLLHEHACSICADPGMSRPSDYYRREVILTMAGTPRVHATRQKHARAAPKRAGSTHGLSSVAPLHKPRRVSVPLHSSRRSVVVGMHRDRNVPGRYPNLQGLYPVHDPSRSHTTLAAPEFFVIPCRAAGPGRSRSLHFTPPLPTMTPQKLQKCRGAAGAKRGVVEATPSLTRVGVLGAASDLSSVLSAMTPHRPPTRAGVIGVTADGGGPRGVKGTASHSDESQDAGPGGVKGAANDSTPSLPVSASLVGVKGTVLNGDDPKGAGPGGVKGAAEDSTPSLPIWACREVPKGGGVTGATCGGVEGTPSLASVGVEGVTGDGVEGTARLSCVGGITPPACSERFFRSEAFDAQAFYSETWCFQTIGLLSLG